MTVDDIRLLYQYDRWANQRILQGVSALNDEQLNRDLGGAFRSVRDTLLHIVGGEWIWLQYWKEDSHSPESIVALQRRRDDLFKPDQFPKFAAVERKWAQVREEQIEFVESITNEMLARKFPYRGAMIELAYLMQHVSNHSTYHRGQIAFMMRQLKAQPQATDFHIFLAEGRSEGSSGRK